MSQIFSFPLRVYYEDTDAGGVVYHASYLRFMERARTEWCRSLGHELGHLMKDGIFFVVRHAELDYRRSAHLEDALVVHSTVQVLGRTQLQFAQQVCLAEDDEKIFCEGKIHLVFINEKARPIAIPPLLLEGFTGEC